MRTGWPTGLLQDDDRGLSKWFASKPDARRLVRERCTEIESEHMNQHTEPEPTTDRELLERAAKAYWGTEIDDVCTVRWLDEDQAIGYTHADNQDHNGCDLEFLWSPLTDDGDALRLAVSLLIQVVQDRMGFVKVGWSVGFDSGTPSMDGRGPWYLKEWLSDHSGDRQAATRHAIVRAAAAIGKAMPCA